MSDPEIDDLRNAILELQANQIYTESETSVLTVLVGRLLKEAGLRAIDGIDPMVWTHQHTQRIVNERIAQISDHHPALATALLQALKNRMPSQSEE